jgi:hypothetical protein
VIAVLCAGCTQVPPERALIDDAAAALGGADRLLALTTLTIEGSGTAPNAGQNRMPDDELPVWKVNEYVRTIDLAQGRTRVQQVREAGFLFAGALVQRQTQGLDGDVAYTVAPDGTSRRASEAAARERRVELLHHPVTAVRAALDPGARLANLRTEGAEQLVDVTTAAGDDLTIVVDASTHLPVRLISMSANPNMGDVAIETTIADYEEVDGVRLPRRLTTRMDRYLQFDLQVSRNALNDEMADLAVPSDVRSAAPPAPPVVEVTAEPWRRASGGSPAPATIAASCSSSTTTSCCSRRR